MLSRYRGKTKCSACKGKRLRPEAQYVKINDHSITDLVEMPLDKVRAFFNDLELNEYDQKIAKRLLTEIRNRLDSFPMLDWITLP